MSFALDNPFHSIIYVSIYHLLSQDDLEEFSSEKTLLIYISKKKNNNINFNQHKLKNVVWSTTFLAIHTFPIQCTSDKNEENKKP